MDIIMEAVRENPGINRRELMKLTGLKLWAISPNTQELKKKGLLFIQNASGKDRFYTVEYAEANNIPPRVFKEKVKRNWSAPDPKDPPLIGSQRMFNKLFQVAR